MNTWKSYRDNYRDYRVIDNIAQPRIKDLYEMIGTATLTLTSISAHCMVTWVHYKVYDSSQEEPTTTSLIQYNIQ